MFDSNERVTLIFSSRKNSRDIFLMDQIYSAQGSLVKWGQLSSMYQGKKALVTETFANTPPPKECKTFQCPKNCLNCMIDQKTGMSKSKPECTLGAYDLHGITRNFNCDKGFKIINSRNGVCEPVCEPQLTGLEREFERILSKQIGK